jgi:hypothetical protein
MTNIVQSIEFLSVKSYAVRLQWPPAADKINDEHDHSDHEQQMDQRATKMADEAKQPEHEQDYEYCPEHRVVPFG